jgi:predicted glycoside hydrolase/deacetylase ChbG (UPF0249 family)
MTPIMTPNPALLKLGFSDKDRVALIHTDDIGMCQASVSAFQALWEAKAITCGATMMPCSWSNAAADYCKATPDVDMGVHATLTSEWHDYRWGPLTHGAIAGGLTDTEGRFHKTSEAVAQSADPAAAKIELEAQMARALAAGINVTHMDTHMGSVMHGPLFEVYTDIALANGVPPFSLRLSKEQWAMGGYPPETVDRIWRKTSEMEAAGVPIMDRILSVSLSDERDRVEKTKAAFSGIRPGQMSYFILHPSHDTPELRNLCPDWRSRVGDLEMFLSGEMAEHIEAEKIHLVGYKELKALMP